MMRDPEPRWRIERERRRQRRRKSVQRERIARRLRSAWPEAFAHLTDAQVMQAVEVGVLHVHPLPARGTHAWGKWMAAKSGQAGLRKRLHHDGVSPTEYFRWLARRGHGSTEPCPLPYLPQRPSKAEAAIASEALRASVSTSPPVRRKALSNTVPSRQSVPGKPWLLGDWKPRR